MRKVAPSRRSLGPARSSIPEATITTVDSASAGSADRICFPRGSGTVAHRGRARSRSGTGRRRAPSRVRRGSLGQCSCRRRRGRLKTDWRAEPLGLVPQPSTGDEQRRARASFSTGASPASAAPSPTSPRARSPTGDAPEALDVLRTLRDHVKAQGAFALRIGPAVPVRRWHADTVKAAIADDAVGTLRDVTPARDRGRRGRAFAPSRAARLRPPRPTTASPRASRSTPSTFRSPDAPRRTCSPGDEPAVAAQHQEVGEAGRRGDPR